MQQAESRKQKEELPMRNSRNSARSKCYALSRKQLNPLNIRSSQFAIFLFVRFVAQLVRLGLHTFAGYDATFARATKGYRPENERTNEGRSWPLQKALPKAQAGAKKLLPPTL